MKISLTNEEITLLKKLNFNYEAEKEFNNDEIENLLDKIYLNEATNVGFDDEQSNKYADLADKIEDKRAQSQKY
ncbi:MAG: hypothetical protein GXY87_01770 [Tissierellia bacterium]|nr:hypothetical protein [Tissierellia bacterium]